MCCYFILELLGDLSGPFPQEHFASTGTASKSQEMCPSGGTQRVTSMPVLENGHRTIRASCYQYHRECNLVFALSWPQPASRCSSPARGSERPLVYQPLVPQILTACYQVVLLPLRNFGEWPPVARDVYYAVALFLQVRARILNLSRSTEERDLSSHTSFGHASHLCQALC